MCQVRGHRYIAAGEQGENDRDDRETQWHPVTPVEANMAGTAPTRTTIGAEEPIAKTAAAPGPIVRRANVLGAPPPAITAPPSTTGGFVSPARERHGAGRRGGLIVSLHEYDANIR